MYKDITISVLAAVLFIRHPWYAGCTGLERTGIGMGTAAVVFIFLLFLEEIWEKWKKYRKRVKEVQETVKRIRERKGREKPPSWN